MGEILVGDVRAMLRTLESESVHVVVTSPPYWSLRSYSTDPQVWGGDPFCAHDFEPEPTAEGYTGKRKWQHSSNGNGEVKRDTEPGNWTQVTRGDTCRHCGAWRGELGGEPTPELYVEHIVAVFHEVRRVLRRDGTCWVNLGSSYMGGGRGGNPTESDHRKQATNVGSHLPALRIASGNQTYALRDDLTPDELAYVLAELSASLRQNREVGKPDLSVGVDAGVTPLAGSSEV